MERQKREMNEDTRHTLNDCFDQLLRARFVPGDDDLRKVGRDALFLIAVQNLFDMIDHEDGPHDRDAMVSRCHSWVEKIDQF